MLRIDCYISETCGSEGALRDNIRQALELEGRSAEVNMRRTDAAEAARLGLHGSPSVFINGSEVQPSPDITGFS